MQAHSRRALRFDRLVRSHQNGGMRTRLAVIMTALWMVAQVTAAAQMCAGWQSSAAARMACCKAAAHSCPHRGQNAADQCCAKGEQSQQRFTAKDTTHLAKPVLVAIAIADTLAPLLPQSPHLAARPAYVASSHLTTPHAPPHVLFSVFRI